MKRVRGSPSRPGPEAELVLRFIRTGLPEPQDGEYQLIFIEPHLLASTPDIVAVYWDPSVAVGWPEERHLLKITDLRLAQLLLKAGPLVWEELRAVFPRRLNASLKRLERAGVASLLQGSWQLNNTTEIFAVRRIIAFEAKISRASKGLDQAYLNTWFASESYLLTAAKAATEPTIKRARRYGIGLWSAHEDVISKPLLEAKGQPIPQSYASWIFNELVWNVTMEVNQ